MKDPRDRPAAVREGEELDRQRLEAWLTRSLPELDGPVAVQQYPSGYSNLTYLVTCGARELVLRRPPAGSPVRTAHDMGREFRILSGLAGVYPRAPRPLAYCDDASVLGAPFYVMERAEGVILRRELPRGLDLGRRQADQLATRFVRELVRLHSVDFEAAGLGDLGRPNGYVGRQVEGWRERWESSRTGDVPAMEEVGAWLSEGLPPAAGAALIHNDFKYDNLVLDADDPTRIVAVLDWEMATVGEPLMDLGTTLGYWVEADDPEPLRRFRFCPTDLPGSPTRRELAERYAAISGRSVDGIAWYYAFGLFKIAVIAQQIFYRYRQGLTGDERFAPLEEAVRALAEHAAAVAGGGRI